MAQLICMHSTSNCRTNRRVGGTRLHVWINGTSQERNMSYSIGRAIHLVAWAAFLQEDILKAPLVGALLDGKVSTLENYLVPLVYTGSLFTGWPSGSGPFNMGTCIWNLAHSKPELTFIVINVVLRPGKVALQAAILSLVIMFFASTLCTSFAHVVQKKERAAQKLLRCPFSEWDVRWGLGREQRGQTRKLSILLEQMWRSGQNKSWGRYTHREKQKEENEFVWKMPNKTCDNKSLHVNSRANIVVESRHFWFQKETYKSEQ